MEERSIPISRMAASMRWRSRRSSSSSACGSSLRAVIPPYSAGQCMGGEGIRTEGGREDCDAVRRGSWRGFRPLGSGGEGAGAAGAEPKPKDRKSIEKPRLAYRISWSHKCLIGSTYLLCSLGFLLPRSSRNGRHRCHWQKLLPRHLHRQSRPRRERPRHHAHRPRLFDRRRLALFGRYSSRLLHKRRQGRYRRRYIPLHVLDDIVHARPSGDTDPGSMAGVVQSPGLVVYR